MACGFQIADLLDHFSRGYACLLALGGVVACALAELLLVAGVVHRAVRGEESLPGFLIDLVQGGYGAEDLSSDELEA